MSQRYPHFNDDQRRAMDEIDILMSYAKEVESVTGRRSVSQETVQQVEQVRLQGISGESGTITTSQNRSRERRLDSNVMILHHQTDRKAATAILSSQRFRRGSSGMAGGGIYFARTPAETDGKAHSQGVYLQARVRLGQVKTIGAQGDQSMTFWRLLREGYDSVYIPRDRPEWVVYNYDQVSDIREVSRT